MKRVRKGVKGEEVRVMEMDGNILREGKVVSHRGASILMSC